MRINEGNEWMKLAETIQGNERCLFSRTLLQVGEGFSVRKISGGSNQFPFWGKRMQLRKSWPSSWEPLAARKTSTSTVLSCLRPSKASQLKISTLNEMIMAERVSWRFEHLSCQFEQHQNNLSILNGVCLMVGSTVAGTGNFFNTVSEIAVTRIRSLKGVNWDPRKWMRQVSRSYGWLKDLIHWLNFFRHRVHLFCNQGWSLYLKEFGTEGSAGKASSPRGPGVPLCHFSFLQTMFQSEPCLQPTPPAPPLQLVTLASKCANAHGNISKH